MDNVSIYIFSHSFKEVRDKIGEMLSSKDVLFRLKKIEAVNKTPHKKGCKISKETKYYIKDQKFEKNRI